MSSSMLTLKDQLSKEDELLFFPGMNFYFMVHPKEEFNLRGLTHAWECRNMSLVKKIRQLNSRRKLLTFFFSSK